MVQCNCCPVERSGTSGGLAALRQERRDIRAGRRVLFKRASALCVVRTREILVYNTRR